MRWMAVVMFAIMAVIAVGYGRSVDEIVNMDESIAAKQPKPAPAANSRQ